MNARSLDRRRLALVTDRFQSSHDGERLAALEAAGRILAAGGATWRTLIDGLADKVSPPRGDVDGDDGGPSAAPQHALDVAAMLSHPAAKYLSPWEQRFLRGCMGFRSLSVKQRAMLAEIAGKLGVEA